MDEERDAGQKLFELCNDVVRAIMLGRGQNPKLGSHRTERATAGIRPEFSADGSLTQYIRLLDYRVTYQVRHADLID